MAELLHFEARPRSDRKADPVPADGATILFFTGVRYERPDVAREAPVGAAKKTRSGGPKRAAASPSKRPRRKRA